MVKRTVPLVATAAHGIPGASIFSTTFQSTGSIAYTRRRSRDPIQSTPRLPSHANACGATAGDGSRRCSRMVGSFILRNQHQFTTANAQPEANYRFLTSWFQLGFDQLNEVARTRPELKQQRIFRGLRFFQILKLTVEKHGIHN